MKVVINKCYGGYSLSPLAVKRLAELQNKECYFFIGFKEYTPVSIEKIGRSLFWTAFDVPHPNVSKKGWYEKHCLASRPENRTDPLLIQVVEELGDKANGACAELRIVEIPDRVEWEIDEYDGIESIHETHQVWY